MNNNSILLNGSFFEEEYQKKIDKLNNLEIKTVYVFDHSINPEIKKLPVYKIMDALSKLDKYDRNFKIGSMVLNIRKREINELMENYLNPLMEIKNFNLGIGIGDNKYEIQKDIYDNNIEEVIKKIIANKNYEENNVNLVIGGSSQKLNALALKYGLGTNQWEGDIINLLKKIEVHSKAKSKELNVSYCTKDLSFDGKTISQDNFEIIYVLSEKKSFNKQIDEIEKQCLN
ncbi:hypothetical protein OAY98_00420 [Acidimicrobiaceae bacterium]|nr:hypothetical protein [Acidimicrobiaceae bacterium]MDC2990234.1 hypothetical protein [Acidimicrobiaceae bacterium]